VEKTGTGILWLIVGPSGVGKDSLIDGARAALADDPRFVFPRREITRPGTAGGEDHIPITMADFKARRAVGAYALCWTANGHGYGVPRAIDDALARGRNVIVNGSRGALDDARSRYPDLRVVAVTVPPEVLRARLEARGRESAAEIEARLARATALQVEGGDVIHFSNDRALAESVAAFVGLFG
jgi:phosphonate metabolism protein PhnN/1,5-bisphosphokinase (PRPP-forming)